MVIPRKGLDEGLFTLKDIYKNIRTTHDYLIYCFIEFAKPYFNISVNSINSFIGNNELEFISFEHSGIKYRSNVYADIYHNVMCLVNRAIQEQFDNASKIYLIDLDYSESTSFVMLNNEQFEYLYENRLMSFVDFEFPEITEWRKSINLDNLPF
ncbi:hypothetical protein [Chondrinema litorale]|uniref:hypothetical protein n=1 Tax=Chondrinema litorale TaxID=2994555 RepID=UPI0025429E96|nr:hypothetical protein [Chondrinema litorale]UZR97166.1 hypothetical protein OQ292_25030 [Chondrinema litorale]